MESKNKIPVTTIVYSINRYLEGCSPDELIYFECEINKTLLNLDKVHSQEEPEKKEHHKKKLGAAKKRVKLV